jgi:hypothetical protein
MNELPSQNPEGLKQWGESTQNVYMDSKYRFVIGNPEVKYFFRYSAIYGRVVMKWMLKK